MTRWKIYNEDAVAWAKNYQKTRFHALLCDAPYHLTSITKRFGKKGSAPAKQGTDGVFQRSSAGFMGQQWDGGDVAFRPETWEAFQEVLYPGAFGMAFSASRNWHRMAVAIEDAGFIIHPTMFFLWVNGQGFPKATRVDKTKDRDAGTERKSLNIDFGMKSRCNKCGKPFFSGNPCKCPKPKSDHPFAGHRYGLQSLKPSVEPIIVFQKPYDGRPLDNIIETGAGALNIDGGRVPVNSPVIINRFTEGARPWGDAKGEEFDTVSTMQGRWPSNLILDEGSANALDKQTGTLVSGKPSGKKHAENNIYGQYKNEDVDVQGFGDAGGASRFFYQVSNQLDEADPFLYQSKVSPKERNAGLDERNSHPTLKPIDLAKYLATLLLPPVEYTPRRIFVPFSGVGSEMIGAGLAGWEHVVGVEFDTENDYIEIAQKRLEHWLK